MDDPLFRGLKYQDPSALPGALMLVVLVNIFVVPVLYCWIEEFKLRDSVH